MIIWRMIRCTVWWHWVYLLVLIGLVLVVAYHTALGLPRMLVGFLAVPAVGMAIGLFFVIDVLHRQAEDPWIG